MGGWQIIWMKSFLLMDFHHLEKRMLRELRSSSELLTWARTIFHHLANYRLSLRCSCSGTAILYFRNKFTGKPAGYGLVYFDTDASALMAMHKLNNKTIPNSQPPIRWQLNHSSAQVRFVYLYFYYFKIRLKPYKYKINAIPFILKRTN